jgi:hypothetical protein
MWINTFILKIFLLLHLVFARRFAKYSQLYKPVEIAVIGLSHGHVNR